MSVNCIICSELFDEINPVCTAKCGHVYHINCLTIWVNQSKTCPYCRIPLTVEDITKIYLNFPNKSEISDINCSRLKNEISNLKSQLLAKDAMVSNLKSKLLAKNDELVTCKKEKNDTVAFVRKAEKRANELQQTVLNLESDILDLRLRMKSMIGFEAKFLDLEKKNAALSDDLEYSNKVLKDAENKIKFYEEALAISNDKNKKQLNTGLSSGTSTYRTVTSGVSTAKRSASVVNTPAKKKCMKKTLPNTSDITNKNTELPSISLPEDENEIEVIQQVMKTRESIEKIIKKAGKATKEIAQPKGRKRLKESVCLTEVSEEFPMEEEQSVNNNRPTEFNNRPTAAVLPPRLVCRRITVGSYSIRHKGKKSVDLGIDRISFIAPVVSNVKKIVKYILNSSNVTHVLFHLGRCLPIMFISTTKEFAEDVRKYLDMSSPDFPYYDPLSKNETQKKITFLMDSMTDDQRNFLRHHFLTEVKATEIDEKTAHEMLRKSTPSQSKYERRI